MSETPHEEPRLFDLPLESSSSDPAPPTPSRRSRRAREESEGPEPLPLFEPEEAAPSDAFEPETDEPVSYARPRPVPPASPAPPTAGLGARARGGLGDLAILAGVGVVAAAGARALEAPIGWSQLPALLGFLLSWSFVYYVVALAFWGQTPGMAWAGVVARTTDDEPLSFGQTARRWAATWLTWALAGLPGLLALGGRSFADRASGSLTFEQAEVDSAQELVA